jgi:hypothetical protein
MALASNVNQQEDFFIADLASITHINGLVCKNLAIFMANDFLFHALATLVNPCLQKM